MKIYVASSWRNPYFDMVHKVITEKFPHTYNFKEGGFHWSEVLGPDWVKTPIENFKASLDSRPAEQHFIKDSVALEAASVTVLVLPCGRSAHLELGVAIGREQHTAIYSPEPFEPELMYKYVNLITDDINVLIESLEDWETMAWHGSIH